MSSNEQGLDGDATSSGEHARVADPDSTVCSVMASPIHLPTVLSHDTATMKFGFPWPSVSSASNQAETPMEDVGFSRVPGFARPSSPEHSLIEHLSPSHAMDAVNDEKTPLARSSITFEVTRKRCRPHSLSIASSAEEEDNQIVSSFVLAATACCTPSPTKHTGVMRPNSLPIPPGVHVGTSIVTPTAGAAVKLSPVLSSSARSCLSASPSGMTPSGIKNRSKNQVSSNVAWHNIGNFYFLRVHHAPNRIPLFFRAHQLHHQYL